MEEPATRTFCVYPCRKYILVIFSCYAAVNFLSVLQYTVIANITSKYYNVGSTMVSLTCTLFMAFFIVFFLFVNCLIEKYDLYVITVIGSGLTLFGNIVKIFSASRDRFYMVLIGQSLCGLAQVFVLTVPSKLANTWFGPEEVSKACAIALIGTQIGVSVGSILSSNLVKNTDDMDAIGYNFWLINVINVGFAVVACFSVALCFKAKPPTPPSPSQADLSLVEDPTLCENLKAIWRNKSYQWILVSIGSSNGIYNCFGIVINTVYLHYFPGYEVQIGTILALSLFSGGFVGNYIFGYILDKYHQFKLTSAGAIFAGAITYILVVLSLEFSQKATYFTIPLFGFFVGSTLFIGFEFATEVMYPTPEAVTVGFFNAFTYIFGIVYSLLFSPLIDLIGYKLIHVGIFLLLLLSSALIACIDPNLRRRQANYTALADTENPPSEN